MPFLIEDSEEIDSRPNKQGIDEIMIFVELITSRISPYTKEPFVNEDWEWSGIVIFEISTSIVFI
jgi:hypothetical protein